MFEKDEKYFHLRIISAFTVALIFVIKKQTKNCTYKTELLQNCRDVIFFFP